MHEGPHHKRGHASKSESTAANEPTRPPTNAPADQSADVAKAEDGVCASGDHFELSELELLAAARRENAAAWRLPLHLELCPLCLDAFEAVMNGQTVVSPETAARYQHIWREAQAARSGLRFRRRVETPWMRRWLAVAAVLLIAAGVGWAMRMRPASIQIEGAGVRVAGIDQAAGPVSLSRSTPVEFVARATLVVDDGSRLTFEPDAQAALIPAFLGASHWRLNRGSVTANIQPQIRGKQFRVETPVATVSVIGTRFEVRCDEEQVQVYQPQAATDANVAAASVDTPASVRTLKVVSVVVFEGVVTVHNNRDLVRLQAGQRATVREGQAMIEVVNERSGS